MPEQRTHDYVRLGITTLFAALDVAIGEVIGSIDRRHLAAEFRKFLTKLNRQVPAGFDVHLICDKPAITIQAWLAAHLRFACTSSPPPRRGSTRSNAGSRR